MYIQIFYERFFKCYISMLVQVLEVQPAPNNRPRYQNTFRLLGPSEREEKWFVAKRQWFCMFVRLSVCPLRYN